MYVNTSALGGLGVQVGNGDRVNIYINMMVRGDLLLVLP